ncbi:ABC transporter substrate-binding protein [bacterium]|nr:ABC transporter substrate-binding protein [bacterium]
MAVLYGQKSASASTTFQRGLVLSCLLTISLLLTGCRPTDSKSSSLPSKAISSDSVGKSIPLSDAKQLSIDETADGYRIRIRASFDDGASEFEHELTRDASKKDALPIPVQRIICLSSSHLGFLEELDALDIVAGVTNKKYVANSTIRRRIDDGKVKEIGEGTQLNLERILILQPDLVLAYGVSAADLEILEPIKRAGIPLLICADYTEQSPLGRAEWIKFFGLLTGKLSIAESRFESIRGNYQTLAEAGRRVEPKPTVLVNADFQGTWYVPGGDSYMAQFIRDAGGNYMWAGERSTRVQRLDFESVLARAQKADIWINVGMWTSLDEGKANNEKYALFDAFQKGNVYNHHRPGNEQLGNDFFERGVVRPDLVLGDLLKVFHPSLREKEPFVWYQRLQAH